MIVVQKPGRMHTQGMLHTWTLTKVRGQFLQHATQICIAKLSNVIRKLLSVTLTSSVVREDEIEYSVRNELSFITRDSLMVESLQLCLALVELSTVALQQRSIFSSRELKAVYVDILTYLLKSNSGMSLIYQYSEFIPDSLKLSRKQQT